jgi:hypothetical protein
MRDIEDFNKIDLSDVIRYMKKYVDIRINDAIKGKINEALETIYVEEIILFMKNLNRDDVKYRDPKFIDILSMYLNEEIKFYIISKGYVLKKSCF